MWANRPIHAEILPISPLGPIPPIHPSAMTTVGQKERRTQQRVVKLFCDALGYRHLGNWEERENNRNIEPDLLRAWLKQQGHEDALINKALYELEKAAGDTSKSLYDRNHA